MAQTPAAAFLSTVVSRSRWTGSPSPRASTWASTAAPGCMRANANLTLRQVTFYRNLIDVFFIPSSDAYGAGAMVAGGTLVVDASTFRENSARGSNAGYGGGLVISYTTAATVTNSLFQDNDAWWGSGLFFWGPPGPGTPFTLRNNIFTGNGFGTSPGVGYGGYAAAIRISTARAQVIGNTITNNKASNDRGALSSSTRSAPGAQYDHWQYKWSHVGS